MKRDAADAPPRPPPRHAARRLFEIAHVFLRLGCLSFGGPIAHLGYLRAELVEKRAWLDDGHYGDLVALCQFLPGPASSQVVFSLGMHRAGLLGALLASACFTLPSAALMIALAYGVAGASELSSAGWLHGLKLAAVAVVAQAVWGMGKKLCVDRARLSLCIGAAAVLLSAPGSLAQLGVIGIGGLVGWRLYRQTIAVPPEAAIAAAIDPAIDPATDPAPPSSVAAARRGQLAAGAALVVALGLLLVLPAVASVTEWRELEVFDAFYRSGALVFGGGHVVLPLLRAELVPRGWLTDAQFLTGYGGAQALPGPLFAFAAYLGAAMYPGPTSWLYGVWCLLGIFLPGWLLVGGALPFWRQLRTKRWAQAALAGANATVVGVLLAALYDPLLVEGVRAPRDAAVALLAFALLAPWKLPPWLVVGGCAAAGQWLL